MMFHFDPEKHQYSLDGVILPSLTQMLTADGWSAHLDAIDPEVVRRKASWGTALHDNLLRAEHCPEKVLPEFQVHAAGWLALCKKMKWNTPLPIWKNAELPVLADIEGFKFGFIPDRAAPEVIVEIKGTASSHESHNLQTALQVLGMGYERSIPRYVVYFDKTQIRKCHRCGNAVTRNGISTDVFEEAERIVYEWGKS